eukprot:CAMPEP_0177769942 /NCGR_PEP_ID=MMETSP0491_2-20121128/10629_1 /TAXON_ID=63592 /ORGANISM="Tetraselmis chuii, Strain PLY429" /LENGTH=31 /DNA_ID= /DNA_START= /DNA_END= /DNA_ORIENTATION=
MIRQRDFSSLQLGRPAYPGEDAVAKRGEDPH